jgi:hypothetical protein
MPGFNMVDVYSIFSHSFSSKAKETLDKKAEQLVYQYNEEDKAGRVKRLLGRLGLNSCVAYKDLNPDEMWQRKFDSVHFVSSKATKEQLPKAIEKVIATVNHVADKGFTKASMVQLSVLETRDVSKAESHFIVLSYITLTTKGADYVKQHMPKMFVVEGGIPYTVDEQ